jgi:hypothetical protein
MSDDWLDETLSELEEIRETAERELQALTEAARKP